MCAQRPWLRAERHDRTAETATRKQLRRRLDPDPGRPGGGAQAAGHVHRRHLGRHRPAPPRVRGAGQLHRRGAGGALHRDPRHHPHGQLDLRDRQRPRHPDRHQVRRQARAQAQRGRDRHDRAARGRQVRPEQLQGVGRPARRGCVVRERPVEVAQADGAPRRPRAPHGFRARHSAEPPAGAGRGAGRQDGRSLAAARVGHH